MTFLARATYAVLSITHFLLANYAALLTYLLLWRCARPVYGLL